MPSLAPVPAFQFEIDGSQPSPTLASSIVSVIVDDSLHLPDTFALWIQETPDFDPATAAGIEIGTKVKISAQGADDTAPVQLIEGEVTAIEAEYSQEKASTVVIRGYDVAHKLMRGRKNRVFTQSTYSDAASKIADDNGYGQKQVTTSATVYPFLHQYNQTDWEFLKAMARLVGYEVAIRDGTFIFGPPTEASSAPGPGNSGSTNPLQLVFGHELAEFRPRITAGGQAANVEVHGWDVPSKKAIVGSKPVSTTSVALAMDTPASLAGKVGNPTFISNERPIETQGDADNLAAALAEQIGSAFAEATGKAFGNPHLRAGQAVTISQVGRRFAGKYTLTHTRHTYDNREGYITRFEVSGRQERSLLGLTAGAGGGGAAGVSPGVQVGIVTDLKDPDNLGRVRVQLPYGGDDFITGWARIAMPGIGKDRGIVWMPEVNDEVLVAFDHGSVGTAFVLGGLFNGKDTLPGQPVNNGVVEERSFTSQSGQKIVISDKSGSEGIKITSKDGSLTIHVDAANKKILIDGGGSAEVKVSSGGNFTIDSQGKVQITGAQGVEISSNAQTKVSGNGGLNLESSAMTAVKGSQVQLG